MLPPSNESEIDTVESADEGESAFFGILLMLLVLIDRMRYPARELVRDRIKEVEGCNESSREEDKWKSDLNQLDVMDCNTSSVFCGHRMTSIPNGVTSIRRETPTATTHSPMYRYVDNYRTCPPDNFCIYDIRVRARYIYLCMNIFPIQYSVPQSGHTRYYSNKRTHTTKLKESRIDVYDRLKKYWISEVISYLVSHNRRPAFSTLHVVLYP